MISDWQLQVGAEVSPFGTAASGFQFASAPDIGDPEFDSGDEPLPYDDGLVMGVDLIRGTTVTFELNVLGTSHDDTLGKIAALRRAWRADAVRSVVGGVALLRSHTGRSVMGRPRRFSADLALLGQNTARVTADFATVDDLWYGDEQSATATLGYRAAGGFTFPVKFPLTTSPESDRSQVITVTGDASTWGVYEITGPVLSPWFEIPGLLRYSFTGLRLAYDQWLTIDTRPWAREVYRNDGAPLGGALDASSTLLAGAPIPPGQHEFLLRGTTTGTPRATVRWRDANTTL